MRTRTYLAAALVTLCLLLVFPVPAAAEEWETVEETVSSELQLPEQDTLYSGYLQQMFYPERKVATFGALGREQLSDLGKQLYDRLKTQICLAASGETAQAYVTIANEDMVAWGAEMTFSGETAKLAFSEFLGQFPSGDVFTALLHDCAYELYWFDKVTGMRQGASVTGHGDGSYTFSNVTFYFPVAGNYQPEGYDSAKPTVDAADAAAAVIAADNARQLVQSCMGGSDCGKLEAYKQNICDLVSYDREAAGDSGDFSTDDAPWQLVSVFDGDPDTNVVCEGYSKAFAYLCELTDFEGTVQCYTIVGETNDLGHMWNLVTLEGRQYLADITNSEPGTAGANGELFLSGGSGSVTEGYRAKGLNYVYDADMLTLWGDGEDSILQLASLGYYSGDLNLDGSLTLSDAEMLLWEVLFAPSGITMEKADFSGDKTLTEADVQCLLWKILFPEK